MKTPNQAATGNGAVSPLFHIAHSWRAEPKHYRWRFLMPTRLLSFLFLALLSGCAHRFGGTIVFRNSSTTPLDWVTSSGFEREPIAGFIGPGASKGSMLNSMSLPKEITIRWTIGGTSSSTNIMLPSVPPFARGDLVFDYTSGQVWITRYESQ